MAGIEIKQVILSVREGLLSGRPAASNVQGQFYYATDTGTLYLSTGSDWVVVGGGSFTAAANGLRLVAANTVGLGGTLTTPTTITTGGNLLNFQQDANNEVLIAATVFQVLRTISSIPQIFKLAISTVTADIVLSAQDIAAGTTGEVRLTPNGGVFLIGGGPAGGSVVSATAASAEIEFTDSSGNVRAVTLSSTGMLVSDGTNKGLVNAADYSANFVNESLVTMRYVLGQINAITRFVLKTGDTMTGPLNVQSLLYAGSSNLAGVSLAGFYNSMPAGQLLIGWNRSGFEAEIDFIMTPGTAGSTTGGFKWKKISNTGVETLLADINGDTADFASTGRLVPGVVDNSFAAPAQVLCLNPADKAIEQRPLSSFLADLGIAFFKFAENNVLNQTAGITLLAVSSSSAADASYRINPYLVVTSSTLGVINYIVSYTDINGGAHSVTIINVASGALVSTIASVQLIRVKLNTLISITITLTGTANYDAGVMLEIQN